MEELVMMFLTGKKGFTLIELIAVLGIITMMLFLLTPFTKNSRKVKSRRGAAETIVVIIRDARQLASTHNESCTVVFNQGNRTVWVEDNNSNQITKTYTLPKNVVFPGAKALNNITFSPRGKITSTPVTSVYVEHSSIVGQYDRIDLVTGTGQTVLVKNTAS